MRIVVDANILFAAIISPTGITKRLLYDNKYKFISPELLLDELKKYRSEIEKKSGIPTGDFDKALDLIIKKIEIISFDRFEPWLKTAKEISPDPNDSEYFAVALAFNCPLWTNDKLLKKQSSVKVFSTSELLQFLS